MARSHRTARWVGLTAFMVFAAAVAFGAKLWHKAPTDFFLPPTTEADASVEPAPLGPSPSEASAAGVTAGTSGAFAPLAGGVSPLKPADPFPRDVDFTRTRGNWAWRDRPSTDGGEPMDAVGIGFVGSSPSRTITRLDDDRTN